MVKSGEVNQTCGDVYTHSSRPRLIFNPSDNYCGLLTYIQDQLFRDVKNSIPSFCHGDNSDSLKYRIKSILGQNPAQYKSVSMDGSAFDSTQHYSIIEVVDNQFFTMFSRRITEIVEKILFNEGIRANADKIVKGLLHQATSLECDAYFDLPLQHIPNAARSKKLFGKAMPCLTIRGTTYSGHPTRTTLGNTL